MRSCQFQICDKCHKPKKKWPVCNACWDVADVLTRETMKTMMPGFCKEFACWHYAEQGSDFCMPHTQPDAKWGDLREPSRGSSHDRSRGRSRDRSRSRPRPLQPSARATSSGTQPLKPLIKPPTMDQLLHMETVPLCELMESVAAVLKARCFSRED